VILIFTLAILILVMHTFGHIQARNVTVSVNVYLKGSAESEIIL